VHKNKTFLGIIPARGGSTRLPKKNILKLNGKPLITWSIEAGLKSAYIDKLIVSSDNDEILNIANNHPIDTLRRPNELADDKTSSFETIKHVIDNSVKYDYVVMLQATSPLRNHKHIDKAIELLEEKNADAIISVCEVNHNPLWSNIIDDSLSLKGFLKDDVLNKRSQDLEKYYQLNGAIYICKISKFIEEKGFFLKDNIYAFKMDRGSSIDIDERIDLKIAEALIENS
jgi:CMP-N-acetylneuraminic acid synthetase